MTVREVDNPLMLRELPEAAAYVSGEGPAPIRAGNKNRHHVLVHGMYLPSDQGLLVRRRSTRKATGQPRKTKSVVVRGESVVTGLEEVEVLGAMCALLLTDPRDVVTLHIERPSTYAVWTYVLHGGELHSDEPIVSEIVSHCRTLARGVWVTTEVGGRTAWDPRLLEHDILGRVDRREAHSLLKYARECLGEHKARGVELEPCMCNRREYSGHEVVDLMRRVKSGGWLGNTAPVRAFFRCPTGRCFHTTTNPRERWT